jgi:uncharacterized protein (TIGR04255 family)
MTTGTPITEHHLDEYQAPPVRELAMAIQFDPLQGWNSRHIGQFWMEVAEQYPTTEDHPPIFSISERGPRLEILQIPPLRRTFLISRDQNYVIQSQESRFLFNWRRIKETDVYPRFGAIARQFLDAWGRFSNFVTREKVGNIRPSRYELTYVNHIEQGDRPLADTVESYVKLFNWSNLHTEVLTPPTGISTVWTFSLPGQLGFGQANLSQGVKSDGRAILMLVMSCTGDSSPKYSLNDWFAETHEWLAQAFAELTTERAQKEWGRKQ